MTARLGAGTTILQGKTHDDAVEAATRWLLDDDGRFILILANFGTGKTFLLRELARRLTDQPGAPVPILVELRSLQLSRSLDALIAQHLVPGLEEAFDIKKFRYMLEKGPDRAAVRWLRRAGSARQL